MWVKAVSIFAKNVLLHPSVVVEFGSHSHGLTGTGPVDGPALVGRSGPARGAAVGHGQRLVRGQNSLGALLGLLGGNLEIERRLVMAHKVHVSGEHGELTDELEGGGRREEHDRFGHGLELARYNLDGRAFLHGITKGDDFARVAGGRGLLVHVGGGLTRLAAHHAAEGSTLALATGGVLLEGFVHGGVQRGVQRGVQVGLLFIRRIHTVAVALMVAAVAVVLVLVGINFIHLVSKGGGLPAQRLTGIEALVASPGANDAVVRQDRKEVGHITLGRIIDPALIRVGNDDHLAVLGSGGQAPFSTSTNLVEEILVLKFLRWLGG